MTSDKNIAGKTAYISEYLIKKSNIFIVLGKFFLLTAVKSPMRCFNGDYFN